MHGMQLGTAGLHQQVGLWLTRHRYLTQLVTRLLQSSFTVYMTSEPRQCLGSWHRRPKEGVLVRNAGASGRVSTPIRPLCSRQRAVANCRGMDQRGAGLIKFTSCWLPNWMLFWKQAITLCAMGGSVWRKLLCPLSESLRNASMNRIVGLDRQNYGWIGWTAPSACARTDLTRASRGASRQQDSLARLPAARHAAKQSRFCCGFGHVPGEQRSLRNEALDMASRVGPDERLWLHWGMSLLAYPFFRERSRYGGPVGRLQGVCWPGPVQRRMMEGWGQRTTLERAVGGFCAPLWSGAYSSMQMPVAATMLHRHTRPNTGTWHSGDGLCLASQ